jgi:AraC-like DNA-binding protein
MVGPRAGSDATRKMRKVNEHVENHLGSRITIEQLSSTIHLSRWHFSRVFSRATGWVRGNI